MPLPSSKSLEQNKREYERLIEIFKAHDIGYFFYNGGGDSADTCYKVSQLSEKDGLPVQAIHVPKRSTTTCRSPTTAPVFGSVANTSPCRRGGQLRRYGRWPRPRPRSSSSVMGRHAGWIATRPVCLSGQRRPGRDPVPEVEFDKDKFLANVDAKVREHGYCTIVVPRAATGRTAAVPWRNKVRVTPSAMLSSVARHLWSPT